MRQIAGVSFVRRHREDLAARFKHRAGAGWRDPGVLNAVGYFFVVRPGGRQIASDANVHLGRFAARRIENVNSAELLVNQGVGARGKRLEIKTFVVDDLLDRSRFSFVGEQRHRPAAVGKKIDRVAEPYGMLVIRILARYFFKSQIAQPDDVNRRALSSSIALPRSLPDLVGDIGDAPSVRRKPRSFPSPHRQHFRRAAFHRNGVHAVKIRIRFAVRMKQHLFAVRRPAVRDVRTGMTGQPLRFAAFGGNHKHIDVPVVLPGKRNPLSVWRQHRRPFVAAGSELPRVTALPRHAPQIAAVGEDHLRLAERRRMRQQAALLRPPGCCRASQHHQRTKR